MNKIFIKNKHFLLPIFIYTCIISLRYNFDLNSSRYLFLKIQNLWQHSLCLIFHFTTIVKNSSAVNFIFYVWSILKSSLNLGFQEFCRFLFFGFGRTDLFFLINTHSQPFNKINQQWTCPNQVEVSHFACASVKFINVSRIYCLVAYFTNM